MVILSGFCRVILFIQLTLFNSFLVGPILDPRSRIWWLDPRCIHQIQGSYPIQFNLIWLKKLSIICDLIFSMVGAIILLRQLIWNMIQITKVSLKQSSGPICQDLLMALSVWSIPEADSNPSRSSCFNLIHSQPSGDTSYQQDIIRPGWKLVTRYNSDKTFHIPRTGAAKGDLPQVVCCEIGDEVDLLVC